MKWLSGIDVSRNLARRGSLLRIAMRSWLRFVASVAVLAAFPKDLFAADAAHPTVVELFQSQGCSDCPPAVANVAAISEQADVLALVFAVDYWDRLGWKDTFSKPEWTAGQYAYPRSEATASIRRR